MLPQLDVEYGRAPTVQPLGFKCEPFNAGLAECKPLPLDQRSHEIWNIYHIQLH